MKSKEPICVNVICILCKHYVGWHQNDTVDVQKLGQCEYRADGVLCSCKEFKP